MRRVLHVQRVGSRRHLQLQPGLNTSRRQAPLLAVPQLIEISKGRFPGEVERSTFLEAQGEPVREMHAGKGHQSLQFPVSAALQPTAVIHRPGSLRRVHQQLGRVNGERHTHCSGSLEHGKVHLDVVIEFLVRLHPRDSHHRHERAEQPASRPHHSSVKPRVPPPWAISRFHPAVPAVFAFP